MKTTCLLSTVLLMSLLAMTACATNKSEDETMQKQIPPNAIVLDNFDRQVGEIKTGEDLQKIVADIVGRKENLLAASAKFCEFNFPSEPLVNFRNVCNNRAQSHMQVLEERATQPFSDEMAKLVQSQWPVMRKEHKRAQLDHDRILQQVKAQQQVNQKQLMAAARFKSMDKWVLFARTVKVIDQHLAAGTGTQPEATLEDSSEAAQ